MRLIDADLLLQEINGEENQRADKLMSEWYAEMVKRQPIAYDVDKVVDRLEEAQYEDELLPCSLVVEIEEAKRIVKSGGIE